MKITSFLKSIHLLNRKYLLLITLLIINDFCAQDKFQNIILDKDLKLIKLCDAAYVHISYSSFPGVGRFPSNGLIYFDKNKAFLFDTPVTDSLTIKLVSWIKDSMKSSLEAFVPNHWHNDCIEGLDYLQAIGIPSYASIQTIKITDEKNLPIPQIGFTDSLILNAGPREIVISYFGPAHSTDNIVVWIPSEKILFPGCMVKDSDATNLGNTTDADLNSWPQVILKIKQNYSMALFVIPGHGNIGSSELLEHTLKLLKSNFE